MATSSLPTGLTARKATAGALIGLLACAAWLAAAPFAGLTKFTQPDGTAIELWGQGDEFSAVFETLDGYTVVFDQAVQAYCYAQLAADGGSLISTGDWVGHAQPAVLGLVPHLRLSAEARRAQSLPRRQAWDQAMQISQRWNDLKAAARVRDAAFPGGLELQPPNQPTVGLKVGLCLLVDFSDAPATVLQSDVVGYLNGDNYAGYGNNGSVKAYFRDVSNGRLTYTNVVTAYVRVPRPKSYYNDTKQDAGLCGNTLIADAVAALKALPNYSTQILPQFDALTVDGANQLIACNVFFAGFNSGVWAMGLWPHSSALQFVGAQSLSPEGKKIWRYQITDIGTRLAIGTFCHENGHMLCGFPDLYDYDYDSTGGAGYFCLMGSGGFDQNPVQVSAYLKQAAGWATPIDLNASSSLAGVVTHWPPGTNFNTFYRYRRPGVSTEYFLIENRQQAARDVLLPGAGVAIWHIDELGDRDNQSLVPNANHLNYEATLVQADNRWDFENNRNHGDARDLYSSANTAPGYTNRFSDTTAPNAHWWNGSASGLTLDRFSALGPTMTFAVGSGAPPIITLHPAGLVALVGSTFSLRVVASGSPPLQYQWYKSGVPLTDGGRLTGATNDTLVVTGAQAADAGGYSVQVRNPFGPAASAVAVVSVVFPPQITVQPQSQWGTAGATVTFFVQAGGSPPWYYQWSKNGAPLGDSVRVSGATSNYLTLTDLEAGDEATYAVMVSNPFGLVTSQGATLTVLPNGSGLGLTTTNGWNANATLYAFGESNTATYGQTFLAPSAARLRSFTLYLAPSNDPGPVEFRFSLFAWDGSKATGPALYSSPVTTTAGRIGLQAYSFHPSSLNLTPGSSYVGCVSASGLFDGVAGHAAAGAVAAGSADSHFVFLNNRNDPSQLTNTIWGGSNNWSLAFVTAFEGPPTPPRIEQQPLAQAAVIGSSLTLGVLASGSEPLFYQWRKDGTPLTEGARLSGTSTDSLGLSGLTLGDSGPYTVTVSNVYGVATSAVALVTVGEAPALTSQPQTLKALAGDTVRFAVTVAGTPPLECQWRKDLRTLPVVSDVALILSNVQTNDAGGYSAVIRNAFGSVTSAVATLSVRAAVTVGPDAFGYTAAESSPFAFEDISFTGTPVLSNADDATAHAGLGFGFAFYGQTYSSVSISANGLLTFGAPNSQSLNVNFTNSAPAVNVPHLAPFWDDLVASANGVYYQTLGEPGQRRFVVLWKGAFGFNSPSPLTFEATLYEGRNDIVFQYLSVNSGDSRAWGGSATVGIRDTSGQLSHRVLEWSFNRPALQNGLALRFSPPALTPLAFQEVRQLPDGSVRLRWSGAPGRLNALQVSKDLHDWQALLTVTNQTGVLTFTDPDAPSFGQRFFRVLQP